MVSIAFYTPHGTLSSITNKVKARVKLLLLFTSLGFPLSFLLCFELYIRALDSVLNSRIPVAIKKTDKNTEFTCSSKVLSGSWFYKKSIRELAKQAPPSKH